jgi:hypothetical protein
VEVKPHHKAWKHYFGLHKNWACYYKKRGMMAKKSYPFSVWALIVLQALLGFGAVVSGAMLVAAPDGSVMRMPSSLIEKSPFPNFLIPGLILFTFVGVSPLCIAYGLWKKPAWRWPNAINPFKEFHWAWTGSLAVAAIVMVWLTVELIWVEYDFLHTTYYIWAALILLLTLLPGTRRTYSVRTS